MKCLVCLGDSDRDYHPRCAKRLFGTSRVPRIDVDRAKLHTLALAMTGKTTLTGVQQKISLGYAGDRARMQLVAGKGRFILKPQQSSFPFMPENEQVTMRIAGAAGVETPPHGLVRLDDGSLAYLVRRFDRTDDGRKLAAEDFCQLGQWYPGQKYDPTTEDLVKVLRRHATETMIDVVRFFRLVVFAWWTGNGDMHAKNFTLLTTADGIHRLSPAYDLVCTRLVIPQDDLALAVAGKKSRLRRSDWVRFGAWCQLPPKAVDGALRAITSSSEEAIGLVERSFLPDEPRAEYAALLRENTAALLQ